MENNMSPAMRFFFVVISSIMLLGIWLTGFDKAHWILYVPVVFLYLAAVTGICPGLHASSRLFPDTGKAKAKAKPKARPKKR